MGHKQENKFAIKGKVLHVGMPQYYSERLSKRTVVVEVWVDTKYRQEVSFDFVNENMAAVAMIRDKDWVLIDFQLRGKKNIQPDGRARWFNTIEGIACTKLED